MSTRAPFLLPQELQDSSLVHSGGARAVLAFMVLTALRAHIQGWAAVLEDPTESGEVDCDTLLELKDDIDWVAEELGKLDWTPPSWVVKELFDRGIR